MLTVLQALTAPFVLRIKVYAKVSGLSMNSMPQGLDFAIFTNVFEAWPTSIQRDQGFAGEDAKFPQVVGSSGCFTQRDWDFQ